MRRTAHTQGISSRTLRRHFPTVPAAAYAATWWLPGPVDAVHHVLSPRTRAGSCWPQDLDDPEVAAATLIDPDDDHFDWPPAEFFESRGIPDPLNPGRVSPQPITLRNMLTDLYIIDAKWSALSGYSDLAPQLAAMRTTFPELEAWYLRALHQRADSLAHVLTHVFRLPHGTAQVCAHGYAAIPEDTPTRDVAEYLSAFSAIVTNGLSVPAGSDTRIPARFRSIQLPVRAPEPPVR